MNIVGNVCKRIMQITSNKTIMNENRKNVTVAKIK